MGRKIPGRKHHGVRDPEKQRAQRLAKIKDKINAPPSNSDTQEVSKSLARLIELKEKVKSGAYKLKKKKPIVQEPEFKQLPGESDRAFVNRVNIICQNVQKEAAFADKYGVDIKRNPTTGEVEGVVKRPKDELQILINKAKKEKRDKKLKKKKKKGEEDGPRLTKSQKWQLKKTEKKNKKLNVGKDFSDFKDEVRFGEIAHAPPTLVAPRRVEKTGNAPRPGNKSLLLKKIMQQNQVIDKKGKRKDLPNALRRQLETQQKEVIDAYKKLKAKKYT